MVGSTIISCSVIMKGEKPLRRQDLGVVYRILLAIKEGHRNVTKVTRATGLSPNTVEKYVEIMKAKGLITEERNKERRFRITKKGEDFIFLFQRILILWGE